MWRSQPPTEFRGFGEEFSCVIRFRAKLNQLLAMIGPSHIALNRCGNSQNAVSSFPTCHISIILCMFAGVAMATLRTRSKQRNDFCIRANFAAIWVYCVTDNRLAGVTSCRENALSSLGQLVPQNGIS